MSYQHQLMAGGKWQQMSLAEQMANIGSEVFRAIKSKSKKDDKSAELAFERALELFDLSLQDNKNLKRFGEIARARETFVDFFKYNNQYKQSEESVNNYFFNFNYLARIGAN
jgi:hypothetical protein